MGRKVIIIITSILIVDQIIKIWIKESFAPYQTKNLISGFLQLYYVENKGMAFGATLGSGAFAKYTLSLFRLIVISGIIFYLRKIIKEKTAPFGMVIAVSLVVAGATGNLIDSVCYDLIYSIDPNITWNLATDANNQFIMDPETMYPKLRPHGFLLGSVVDMFQFTTVWPSWMPTLNLTLPSWLGGAELVDIKAGKEIFSAIWNLADFVISIGVGLILVKYRKYFGQTTKSKSEMEESTSVSEPIASQE